MYLVNKSWQHASYCDHCPSRRDTPFCNALDKNVCNVLFIVDIAITSVRQSVHTNGYSPAAIIRNAKIRNIIIGCL